MLSVRETGTRERIRGIRSLTAIHLHLLFYRCSNTEYRRRPRGAPPSPRKVGTDAGGFKGAAAVRYALPTLAAAARDSPRSRAASRAPRPSGPIARTERVTHSE